MTRHTPRHETVVRRISPKRAALAAAILAFSAVAIVGPARAADVGVETIEWKPERAPEGPTVIVVGIAEQRAQIFRNGVRIGSTPISSGRPGHDTPTGLFAILEKKRKHRSNLYNDAPMPNMQRLTWDGIALHAGRLPGYPASHGCIRLPHEMSDKLFGVTSHGSLVAVVPSFPETTVLDMTRIPTDGDRDPNTEAVLPTLAASAYGPVSVVLSTADAAMVVMRNGIEVGRAPVDIEPGSSAGESIYVGRAGNVWEPLLSLEDSPMMTPASFETGQLRVDPSFGAQIAHMLVPGTTVVVTDRPLDGPAVLPPVDGMFAMPLAGEFAPSVDAAP